MINADNVTITTEQGSEDIIGPKEMTAILSLAGNMVNKAGELWDALNNISLSNDARPAIEIVTDAALQAALPLVEE